MDDLKSKARNYFIAGEIAERIGNFDIASTNYFKSLAAINDFILSKRGLVAKDHNERFDMLRQYFPEFYKITSSLFVTYRRAYSNKISKEEMTRLKDQLKEAFKNAEIDLPADSEVDKALKTALEK